MSTRVYPPPKGDAEYERDREANIFAMYLIMPEPFVREEVRFLAPHGFDLVEEPAIGALAKKFRVTEQMMILRLVQLGYFDEILR